MARLTGLLALASAVADEGVERFKHGFFRHAIHAQVEVTFAVPFDAHTGDINAVGLSVYIDDELRRYAFAAGGGSACGWLWQ